MKTKRAFTLTEMVVTISIVSLAGALTVPALVQVRDQSQATVCMANQTAIIRALHNYHVDHDMFPYNYADYDSKRSPYGEANYNSSWPTGASERWALGILNTYLGGDQDTWNLIGRDEGEFPATYVCPDADLAEVYAMNPNDKYHACYWTNIAIRLNRGWYNLFSGWSNSSAPPGDDTESGGEARIAGSFCTGIGAHWRTVYQPDMHTLSLPAETMFSGDTSNVPVPYESSFLTGSVTMPGQWYMRPGWGRTLENLGFRHDNSMVVSYVDGHVRRFEYAELDDWYRHGAADPSGEFLIQFTAAQSCNGTLIHTLPPMVVE